VGQTIAKSDESPPNWGESHRKQNDDEIDVWKRRWRKRRRCSIRNVVDMKIKNVKKFNNPLD
jgi:hypothetical protein